MRPIIRLLALTVAAYWLYTKWEESTASLARVPQQVWAQMLLGGHNCDPSYPTICIPPPPPRLTCSDIPQRNFRVSGADPHRFDPNHDGIGCGG